MHRLIMFSTKGSIVLTKLEAFGGVCEACFLRYFADRTGVYRLFARKYFIQQKSERINVALRRNFLTSNLFRRHIGGRSDPRFRSLHILFESRYPEISDPCLSLLNQLLYSPVSGRGAECRRYGSLAVRSRSAWRSQPLCQTKNTRSSAKAVTDHRRPHIPSKDSKRLRSRRCRTPCKHSDAKPAEPFSPHRENVREPLHFLRKIRAEI